MNLNLKRFITIFTGVGILALGYVGMKSLSNSKKSFIKKEKEKTLSAFTQRVQNKNHQIKISATGKLEAIKKIELFAEVSGVFKGSSKLYKEGVSYKKGQLLIAIDDVEKRTNLKAEKSNYKRLITSILPDIKMDYPAEIDKWENYLHSINLDKNLPPLPKASTEKESYYLSAKNVESTYFNIKNSEERLSKHTIYAPFDGVLTEALLNPGTLIRVGQKLGEFVSINNYEMLVPIGQEDVQFLNVGDSVLLKDLENGNSWNAEIARINKRVNTNSQTVDVFVKVQSKELKEGMYLQANLSGREVEKSTSVARKLIIDEKYLFVVNDSSKLQKIEISPIHFDQDSVIVIGVPDNVRLLAKPIIGSYEGMKVEVLD